MADHDLPKILTGLILEIDHDVEVFNLDRAYTVAGGLFLTTASRLGWPQADRALSYVLAVRRLATMNRPPEGTQERRCRERAFDHYKQQRDEVLAWLDPGESLDHVR